FHLHLHCQCYPGAAPIVCPNPNRCDAQLCGGRGSRRDYDSNHKSTAMILVWLIAILMAGGVLAWISGKVNRTLPRWIALAAVLAVFGMMLYLWLSNPIPVLGSAWLIQFDQPWIPQWGISFSLALDGLSLLMLLLTFFLG